MLLYFSGGEASEQWSQGKETILIYKIIFEKQKDKTLCTEAAQNIPSYFILNHLTKKTTEIYCQYNYMRSSYSF